MSTSVKLVKSVIPSYLLYARAPFCAGGEVSNWGREDGYRQQWEITDSTDITDGGRPTYERTRLLRVGGRDV